MTRSLKLVRIFSLSLTVFFQVIILVPSTFSQEYDASVCEKYCFAPCSAEHEFSTCARANIGCNCYRIISIKNPVVIAITALLAFAGFFVAVYCYRSSGGCCRGRASNRVLVEPIVSTINVPLPLPQQRGNCQCHCCQSCQSSHAPSHSGFIVEQPPPSGPSHHIPSEYSRPPPYNEHLANHDQTEYWRNPNPTPNVAA